MKKILTQYGVCARAVALMVMLAQAQTAASGTSFRDCSNGCPEMMVVQQGRFTMGAPAGEEARENLPNELRGSSVPQHLIKIRHKLAIAKFDVTRDEYAQFVAETARAPDAGCTLPAEGFPYLHACPSR
jgi:sulfatase modifying factor 1